MHLYIFVYTVTKCNMHNLSAFVQELYIREFLSRKNLLIFGNLYLDSLYFNNYLHSPMDSLVLSLTTISKVSRCLLILRR